MSYKQDFAEGFYSRLQYWNYYSEADVQYLTALALAMSCLESADYSSNNALKYNNPANYTYTTSSIWAFGKTAPRQDGSAFHSFAIYNNFHDCGCEIADWVHRSKRRELFKGVRTCEQFAAILKSQGYFERVGTYQSEAAEIKQYAEGMGVYYQPPDGSFDESQPFFLSSTLTRLSKPPWLFYLLGLGIALILYFSGWGIRRLFTWRRK